MICVILNTVKNLENKIIFRAIRKDLIASEKFAKLDIREKCHLIPICNKKGNLIRSAPPKARDKLQLCFRGKNRVFALQRYDFVQPINAGWYQYITK